jgi:endonuclease/exonuclease/phosphatase (EEP) superfamily protein YafD
MRRILEFSRHYWAEALALALAAACTAALLGRLSWVTELFTHFRMQYVVLGSTTLLLLGFKHRWRAAVALVPFLASAAWPLAPYLLPPDVIRAAPVDGAGLTVMSINVEQSNSRYRAFHALVRTHSPDVLVLTEITRRWVRALEPLFEAYPHQLLEPRRNGGEGIAVLSRVPVKRARIVPLLSMPAADLVLDVGGRDVRLFGVHLRSPPGAPSLDERNRQIDALGSLVTADSGARIVAGDFNSTPFSPYLADWLRKTGLEDAARGRGYVYTWPAFLPILGIPIDHFFLSEDFQVLEFRRLPAFGSDHYPILVRLALIDG